MALAIDAKKEIVSEINGIAKGALSAAVAEYRGLTVAEMTELRVLARQKGVFIKVVRNTLARRAVEGTEFECMQNIFVGPTILAFASEEPSATAKLFKEFTKGHDKFKVTALAVGGKLHGPEALEAISKLPTRDEALASLLYVMKAPVGNLARALNDIPGRVVRAVAAIKDQKQ